MNVEEAWQSMQHLSANEHSSFAAEQALRQKEAHNVLSLLKERLKWNICFAVVISVLYIGLMIWIPEPLFRAGMGIMLGFTLWATRTGWMEYKQIHPIQSPQQSITAALQFHLDRLRAWMNLQEQVARWVYPVAAATGFIWGASAGANQPVHQVMSLWYMQVTLLVTAVLLSIGGHYLGKWLFKKAFGTIVQQLESILDSLQKQD
jgi:hypothetical protein